MSNLEAQPNNFSNPEIVADMTEDTSVSRETVVFPEFGSNVNEGGVVATTETNETEPVNEELVLDFDKLKDLSPEERGDALYALAGKMVNQVSRERNEKEEAAAKASYIEQLDQNIIEAGNIQSEIDAEEHAIIEKYGSLDAAPKEVRSLGRAHTLGWGFVATAALGTLATMAPTQAEARDHGNILEQFGKQAQRQITGQAREAGADVGSTIGQTMRIIINRKVNEAAVKVLEGADVPVERAPEEVVVVPRNIPGNSGTVYGGAPQVGGVRGGARESINQQISTQTEYTKELHRIQVNWTPERVEALQAQQELAAARLNNDYAQQLQRATTPEQRDMVLKTWNAAKAQLKVRQTEEGPMGEINRLRMRTEERNFNAQADAQAREAYRRNNHN